MLRLVQAQTDTKRAARRAVAVAAMEEERARQLYASAASAFLSASRRRCSGSRVLFPVSAQPSRTWP